MPRSNLLARYSEKLGSFRHIDLGQFQTFFLLVSCFSSLMIHP